MDNVRVFVMDNDGNIYHISKYRIEEWNKWKFLEYEGIYDCNNMPKGAVKVDFVDCFHQSNFEFIVV